MLTLLKKIGIVEARSNEGYKSYRGVSLLNAGFVHSSLPPSKCSRVGTQNHCKFLQAQPPSGIALDVSPKDYDSPSKGQYPRNSMILGITDRVGPTRFFSKFVTVEVVVLRSLATSFCSIPRSSLRFRTWSPIVLREVGYAFSGGIETVSVGWRRGNAGTHVRCRAWLRGFCSPT